MTTEYRVVNVDAPRHKFSPFRIFTSEIAAFEFMEQGQFAYSEEGIGLRLESRPEGGAPEDWHEIDFRSKERRQQEAEERRRAALKGGTR